MFVCPACFSGRPLVDVIIDRDLDHDESSEDIATRLKYEEEGLWSLHVPFRLTTANEDCRPGQYLLELNLEFPNANFQVPRYFHCQIRLSIPDTKSGASRELVIDGDGQSVVNLHGHDLRSFSRVVLKGGDDGIINLQNQLGAVEESSEAETAASSIHEYTFLIDQERQRLIPTLYSPDSFSPAIEQNSARIVLDNQEDQYLILAERQSTWGRSRDCDVVLRFLPRNEDNDSKSRNLSRKHYAITLSHEGIVLRDMQSQTGLEVDYEPVPGERLLTTREADDVLKINVGTEVEVETPLQLSLQISSMEGNRKLLDGRVGTDDVYYQCLNERVDRMWSIAEEAGIDGCRIRRLNNLNEENYLLCYRQLLIGSGSACLVRIQEPGIAPIHARILYIGNSFWLENLDAPETLIVNQHQLPPYHLVPLHNGMRLKIGETSMTWSAWEQRGL